MAAKKRDLVAWAMAPLLVVAMALAGLVTTAAPASAHTGIGAIKEGCGSSYEKVSGSGANVSYRGNRYGRVILGRVPGTNQFCFVVRKTNVTHGESSYIFGVYGTSTGNGDTVDGNYTHFTYHKFRLPADECVSYSAEITHPDHPGRVAYGEDLFCRF